MSTRPTERAVGAGGAAWAVLRDPEGRGAEELVRGGGVTDRALVRGRGAEELGRGRGELLAVVGAVVAGAMEVGAGEVVGATAAARSVAGCAEHPAPPTASSSASAHPIRVTGTSSLPDGQPAIRRAVVQRICQAPGLVRPLASSDPWFCQTAGFVRPLA